MMKRMKRAAWALFLFLLMTACMAVAVPLILDYEVLWGMGMLFCALACGMLLFAEGYERGWDSAKELRLETLEILCRSDALLSLGEDMFLGMREIAGEKERLHDCEAEEETTL